jgi:hypothetical protein
LLVAYWVAAAWLLSVKQAEDPSGGFRHHLQRASRGNRAVATRYDNLAVRYQATAHVAAISEWLQPASSARPVQS